MKCKYNISDIGLREVNLQFLMNFEFFLKESSSLSRNTVIKHYLLKLRTLVIYAKNNGWITIDPFANYNMSLTNVDRGYLTERELSLLLQKELHIERLSQIRDIFVFALNTDVALMRNVLYLRKMG